MNNKGFTLIELLAVLVILTAIMTIALPSITASMERTKTKQDNSRKKILESAAEMYVTDHKNAIYKKMNNDTSCYISIKTLSDDNYLADDANLDSNGNEFNGYIEFIKPNTYNYKEGTIDNNKLCN